MRGHRTIVAHRTITGAALAGLTAVILLTGLVSGCSSNETTTISDADSTGGSATTSTAATPTTIPTNSASNAYPEPVKAQVIKHGPRTQNTVALTFDADLTEAAQQQMRAGKIPRQYNQELHDYLRQTKTPATIFVTGLWANEFPEVVRALGQDPLFEVANHSWNHLAWTDSCWGLPHVSGTANKRDEVRRTAVKLYELTGQFPTYFRFPGLCHSPADVAIVASQGEITVDWDVSASDAFAQDAQKVANTLSAQAQPGSIFVFHFIGKPNAPQTLNIVKKLVPALATKGLKPVTLSQMFSQAN